MTRRDDPLRVPPPEVTPWPDWQCPWCGEFTSEGEREQHRCGEASS